MTYHPSPDGPAWACSADVRNKIMNLKAGQLVRCSVSRRQMTLTSTEAGINVNIDGKVDVLADGKLGVLILLDGLNFLRHGEQILDVRSEGRVLNESEAVRIFKKLARQGRHRRSDWKASATSIRLFKNALLRNRIERAETAEMRRRLSTHALIQIIISKTKLTLRNRAGLQMVFQRPEEHSNMMMAEIEDRQDFHRRITNCLCADRQNLADWIGVLIEQYHPEVAVQDRNGQRPITFKNPEMVNAVVEGFKRGENPYVLAGANIHNPAEESR